MAGKFPRNKIVQDVRQGRAVVVQSEVGDLIISHIKYIALGIGLFVLATFTRQFLGAERLPRKLGGVILVLQVVGPLVCLFAIVNVFLPSTKLVLDYTGLTVVNIIRGPQTVRWEHLDIYRETAEDGNSSVMVGCLAGTSKGRALILEGFDDQKLINGLQSVRDTILGDRKK